nr:Hsp20 family protein [Mesorhizobium sp. LSJC277A00]
MLDSGTRPDWPPYNIEKVDENDYRISMAIAGFSQDEVELTQHGPELVVVGQKADDQSGRQLLHQGIAYRSFRQTFKLADHMKIKAAKLENGLLSIDIVRSFRQTFKLADHMKIKAAKLENGLLSIDIVREIPEELKPRRISIGVGDTPTAATQITPDTDRARKAA